jgi:hypothetical protein
VRYRDLVSFYSVKASAVLVKNGSMDFSGTARPIMAHFVYRDFVDTILYCRVSLSHLGVAQKTICSNRYFEKGWVYGN